MFLTTDNIQKNMRMIYLQKTTIFEKKLHLKGPYWKKVPAKNKNLNLRRDFLSIHTRFYIIGDHPHSI